MKIKFWCDSGANIHSCNKSDEIDLEAEYDITDEQWSDMSETERLKLVEDWVWNNGLDIGYEEL